MLFVALVLISVSTALKDDRRGRVFDGILSSEGGGGRAPAPAPAPGVQPDPDYLSDYNRPKTRPMYTTDIKEAEDPDALISPVLVKSLGEGEEEEEGATPKRNIASIRPVMTTELTPCDPCDDEISPTMIPEKESEEGEEKAF